MYQNKKIPIWNQTSGQKTEYASANLACIWNNDKFDFVLIARNHLNQVIVLTGYTIFAENV